MTEPSANELSLGPRPSGHSLALTTALVYAAFGALWILLSDTLLSGLLEDRDLLLLVSTVKGWLFVVLSALLIYVVSVRFHEAGIGTASPPSWRTRTPWAALAVITLAILGVSLVSVAQTWKQEHVQMERVMRTSGVGIAERLADWHRERLNSAQQIEYRVLLAERWDAYRQAPSDENLHRVAQGLDIYLAETDVMGVELYDHLLNRLWTSGSTAGEPVDPLLMAGLSEVLAKGESGMTGPWIDTEGRIHLAYIGLLAHGSATPGLVVMHVHSPTYMATALSQWYALESSGRSSWLTTSDDTQQVWLTLPDAKMADRTEAPSVQLLREVLDGRTDTLTQVRIPGTRQVGMVLPVNQTNWYVVLEADSRVLWANVLRRGGLFTLAGLLGIFSAFAVAYLLLQRKTIAMGQRALERLRHSREELAESETRYRLLAENAADVVWLLDLATGRFVYVSPSVERMTGFTPQEVMARSLSELLLPESLARLNGLLANHVQRFNAGDASAGRAVIEIDLFHKDGSTIASEISARLIADASGQAVQAQGVTRDLQERRRTEHQIRMLSQATEQSPVSVIITNARGLIEYVNPAFEQMSGYTAGEVIGRNPRMLQSARTPRDTYRRMWEALAQGKPWQGELVNRRKGGEHYLQSVTIAPLRNERQEVVQYISVQMDITAQRAAEERLERLAWFDPLTGLPNRLRLLNDIAKALDQRMVLPGHVGLVILNVDRLKAINDALGRATGDQVLQAVADRLRPRVHAGDVLAHLSGDEFGMLLFDLGEDDSVANATLMSLADDIHKDLEQPLELQTDTLAVTLSIGITLLGMTGDDSAAEALRRADTALHQAKEAGGHQTAFFDAGMGMLVSERFSIEQDLRRGLEAGELRLYLQPQVNQQGQMVSAEALVRWEHPEKGLIGPGLFVPVAENSGLIEPLGQWVLEQVCRLLARLHQSGKRLPVAVNISPRQFHQFDFGTRLLRLVEETGAPASDLILEITEGVVMREVDAVVRRMNELTRHGIRFSIDDFGTGYSSLSYLKRLPIHELKIDQSFVQDAPRSGSDAALVEAILSVARHLKLHVVAEGVETEVHAEFFKPYPHVLLQGYLYGRPEPAEACIRRWLEGR